MATLQRSMASGSKFEDQVITVVRKYSRALWRNVRIETLLTQNGTTEMDILFCLQDVVFILEAKNVSSIMGNYDSKNWAFIGSTSPTRETREYTHLNTITQNNIHVRSFKDLFYSEYQEWPAVVACIVVPNGCRLSPELTGSIYTLSQLDSLLARVAECDSNAKVQRRVAALILGDGVTVQRRDFYTDQRTGIRMKGGSG